MPETWIDDHTGDETIARPDFHAELRAELTRKAAAPEAGRRWWKIIGWSVAAAAVVASVALIVSRDDPDRVGPAESVSMSTDLVPPTVEAGSPLRGGLVDIQWTVVTVDGVAVSAEPAPWFTLQHDGRLAGFDGCNQYGFDLSLPGGWTITGATLGIDEDEMVSTAMGCPEGLTPVVPVADGTQLSLDASGRLTLTSPSGRIYIAQDQSDTTLPKVAQKYVAVGESVMAGAVSQLESAGVLVQATGDSGPEGVKNALLQLGNIGDVGFGTTLVVQVGTNAPLTQAELYAIMAEVPADVAGVVFLTVHADIEYVAANNELIRGLPDNYPNVSIIDWDAQASAAELCADGIHISCNGPAPATFYTNLILEALGLETI